MCGRYTLASSPEDLERAFGVAGWFDIPKRYNIAPSQAVPVVRRGEHGRELAMLKWGLLPRWVKEPKTQYSTINARAETVDTKAAFRWVFQHHRCLVPADGFYEWKQVEGRKQPYYIQLKSREPFAMAGLWERWRGPDDQVIESFTVIVTDANDLVRPLHDRMPVILPASAYSSWLDPATKPEIAKSLLVPYPEQEMVIRPVSHRVNSPKFDDAELVMGMVEG